MFSLKVFVSAESILVEHFPEHGNNLCVVLPIDGEKHDIAFQDTKILNMGIYTCIYLVYLFTSSSKSSTASSWILYYTSNSCFSEMKSSNSMLLLIRLLIRHRTSSQYSIKWHSYSFMANLRWGDMQTSPLLLINWLL